MTISHILIFFEDLTKKDLESIIKLNQIFNKHTMIKPKYTTELETITQKENIGKIVTIQSHLHEIKPNTALIYEELTTIKSKDLLEVIFYLQSHRKSHFALSKSNKHIKKNQYKFLFGYSK
ncbi:MAG: hypothetical protein PF569_10100 [Candidatus Woesearchaeota archaeon]|jgi:hypothetical protein|nr:hypothetical protein [Candidatus Woesearchaeota archaeon]